MTPLLKSALPLTIRAGPNNNRPTDKSVSPHNGAHSSLVASHSINGLPLDMKVVSFPWPKSIQQDPLIEMIKLTDVLFGDIKTE